MQVEPDRWDNTVRKVTYDPDVPPQYRNITSNELKYHTHLPRQSLRRMMQEEKSQQVSDFMQGSDYEWQGSKVP